MGNVSDRIEQESPLSQLISERRKELGLSMKQVADAVGVSEATISRYESGDIKNMRRDRIDKYAKILQVDLRDLIEAEGEDSTDRVIGERLSSIREEKGISRKDIAAYLGISYEAYMFYENGDRKIKADTLAKICDYLDVSADELIGRKKATTGSKPVLCLTELADYFGVTVDRLMGREKADDTMTDTRTHTDFESYDMWANAEKLYELDEKMKRLTERVERLEADGRNDGLTVNTASYWEKFLREE